VYVGRLALGAQQHELAQAHARVDAQGPIRDVAHLEHLPVRDTRLHERRGHVDHEPEAREAAAPLEKAAQVARQADEFTCDAVDRAARLEHVGFVEPL
jgi:hypothetical protein